VLHHSELVSPCRRHTHAIEPHLPVSCNTSEMLPRAGKQLNSIGHRALSARRMRRLARRGVRISPLDFAPGRASFHVPVAMDLPS